MSLATMERPKALLLEHNGQAVLHFFEGGRCVKTATGAAESLRIIYRGQFEIWTWGICRICGCADQSVHASLMLDEGGASWANKEHTLCSPCEARDLAQSPPRFPRTHKATV